MGFGRAYFRLFYTFFISLILCACGPALTPRPIEIGGDQFELASGIVGLYHFDESQSGTAPNGKDFTDSSGNGNHGTKVGTLTLGVSGIQNGAIRSAGSGAVSIPLDLSTTKAVSISIWFWTNLTAFGAHTLFDYTADGSSTNGGFGATFVDGGGTPGRDFAFFMKGTAGQFGRVITSPIPLWHNLIVVLDRSEASGNSIITYLDGGQVSNSVYSGMNTSSNEAFANSTLFLLCRNGASDCLKADIDELVIWDRVLSSDEVSTLSSF